MSCIPKRTPHPPGCCNRPGAASRRQSSRFFGGNGWRKRREEPPKCSVFTATQTSDNIQSEPDFFFFFFFVWKRHLIKKKILDYYTEGISFLIVRRVVLLKLKPFKATRQILMSALCGSVCVLAYYLFDYWNLYNGDFLLYHQCYCQNTPIKETCRGRGRRLRLSFHSQRLLVGRGIVAR